MTDIAATQCRAFAEQFRALRKAAGLTRTDIAQKLHVHVSSVSGWELGKRQPREVLHAKVAQILGCSIVQLFGTGGTPHPSAAALIDSTHDFPALLAVCTERTETLLRIMRFGSPLATAANVHIPSRVAIGKRLAAGTLELQRLEIVYELPRLKELLSNILRYAPQNYRLKIVCAGLKQIAPFIGGAIFDNREILFGGYWTNIPRSNQPCIRFVGEPYITFFNAFWNEVWGRERLINPRGRHDLSAVQEVAIALGLPRRNWKRFVEEAENYTVGDGAPPFA
jgi:transcriptional regulator with XRE-family HTH domain